MAVFTQKVAKSGHFVKIGMKSIWKSVTFPEYSEYGYGNVRMALCVQNKRSLVNS